MIVLQAFSNKETGHGESQRLALELDGAHVREPHDDGRVGQLQPGAIQDVRPRLLRRGLRRRTRHTYPQTLSTTVDNSTLEGGAAPGHESRCRRGEPGRTIAPAFSTPPARRGVLTHFPLSRGLSCDDMTSYTRAVAGSSRPSRRDGT